MIVISPAWLPSGALALPIVAAGCGNIHAHAGSDKFLSSLNDYARFVLTPRQSWRLPHEEYL